MAVIDVNVRLFGRSVKAGDCLVYSGGAGSRSGHRTIWFQGRTHLAHRVAWTVKKGPIPDGFCVLHRCDNPPCVNVEHLFLGTVQDNNADRDAKGRGKMPAPQQVRRLQAGPTVHGTLTAYVKRKCRCEPCRQANREYRGRGSRVAPLVPLPSLQVAALDKLAEAVTCG